MKTSKSPQSAEVTPSKKKLKQARLPFKLISEVSPAPVTRPSRKRKLSATNDESVPKVGKITKENDIVEVVISDEESKDGLPANKPEKIPNPYVKLVKAAIKKKQKAKMAKKKRKKSEVKENGSVETTADEANDCAMEVDEPNEEMDGAKTDSPKENVKLKNEETETVNKASVDIVVLEDSNSSLDVKQSGKIDLSEDNETQDDETTTEKSDKDNLPSDQSDDNKSIESLEKSEQESESPDKKTDSQSPGKVEMKTSITPKRSARGKAKAEENNNKGSPSTKLNESVISNPTTPNQSKSSSATTLDESINESTASGNLTPKQLQKRLESAKKKEKLEKEKHERERKRQEEKAERAKQRQEKEDLKRKEREEKEEAKKKDREEKEELRKKEKEEKEKQKDLEKKQREDKEEMKRKEKEEKEEQRKKEKEAREEEKRKKQEALDLEKQEQEAKKKKAAEAFANFFVPKQKVDKDHTVGAINNSMLSSFTIKSDMRLAPTTRTELSEEQVKALEKLLKEQSVAESELYLKSLRSGKVACTASGKTWPLSDMKDDDVIFVEDELPPSDGAGEIITCDLVPREMLRPKLLSFHENRRPPYWGTWRKKSKFVKPRKPFGQDEQQVEYEVDSDEEWEEEAEGESLDGSAAGSDTEHDPNDEYEVDNELFVPHGYLSDEEATIDEDDVLSLSPETQKARLKHLEDEFESEMKKPTEKLKPRLYGLLWESGDGGKPENCVDAIWSYFGKLSMIMNDPTPLLQPSKEPEETEKKKVKKKKPVTKEAEGEQKLIKSPKTDKKKKSKTAEEKVPNPAKAENKKNVQDARKTQPGINMFLKKIQSA